MSVRVPPRPISRRPVVPRPQRRQDNQDGLTNNEAVGSEVADKEEAIRARNEPIRSQGDAQEAKEKEIEAEERRGTNHPCTSDTKPILTKWRIKRSR